MTGLKFYIIELYISGCIRFHSDKASKKNGGTLDYVVITTQRKD